IIYNFEKCPDVFSIKSYLHSILYNLISNAIKYKRKYILPVIYISSYMENEKEVCIECCDNGLGIDMEKFGDKLFGFYKRFHSHVEGKGLGLHLVKKQVGLLEGRIEVQSVVNKGTTFRIILPA
ncbi:MAG TPA: ATP-binding protein, partial [Cytophaga sp.]|nr:ATP-binding protein [Cytophaga sp.]